VTGVRFGSREVEHVRRDAAGARMVEASQV